MIDICLFGREISDLVRVFGTSLRFILLSSVARGLFIRPVVVVENDARRIFIATAISFAAYGTKDCVSLSYYGDRQAVLSDRRTRRSDLVEDPRREFRPDVQVR